ncbi:unnamed protein product [Moneuplotes crassus]|uniref:Uncharacterized protein n=1 Tax=Euplotes crassus TaxID=5936 RepID=A0AAD2D5J2_EUPCR|nr:unnamed protein product [Moneuplotes crassus]
MEGKEDSHKTPLEIRTPTPGEKRDIKDNALSDASSDSDKDKKRMKRKLKKYIKTENEEEVIHKDDLPKILPKVNKILNKKIKIDDINDTFKGTSIDFDIFYEVLMSIAEEQPDAIEIDDTDKKEETKKSNKKDKPKNPKSDPKSVEFTQNLITTISNYESLICSLGKDDPMREAYAGVINSLKQQLVNATKSKKSVSSEKQLPVNKSLNQLSVSAIFHHPNKDESFQEKEMDKSLENALNVSSGLEKKRSISPVPLPEEDSDVSSEDYESELEEIYTAYSNQFIRDENYNLFEAQYSAKKGINVGKFGRFCADFKCNLPNRKVTKIFNKFVFSSRRNTTNSEFKMSFPIFKNAVKYIPVAEREIKLEDAKFQWRKIKLKLEEGVSSPTKKDHLQQQKKEYQKQITQLKNIKNEEKEYKKFLKRIGITKSKNYRHKIIDAHQPFMMKRDGSRIPAEKQESRMEKIAVLHSKLKHLYEERYGKKKAKKILLNHNMLQRLKEIKNFKKDASYKKRKLENKEEEVKYIDQLVTLATLTKSDFAKFMQPRDKQEIVEDIDSFLTDTLGYEKNEPFDTTDGFKSFPPIGKKSDRKKKGILRFDVKSRIREVNEDTEYDKSEIMTMVSGKDAKSIKTTDQDNTTEVERSTFGGRKQTKMRISKDQIKKSRNAGKDLSLGKHKTQKLPNVKNSSSSKFLDKSKRDQRSMSKSKSKSKKKLSQLAITDGSKFPSKRQMLSVKNHPVGNKTSRMFAPKLNKDLPISPRQQRLMKKPYGRYKSSKPPSEHQSEEEEEPETPASSEEIPVLPDIQQSSQIVALLSSRLDKTEKYSNVIENLNKIKGKPNRSFYQQCIKTQKDIDKPKVTKSSGFGKYDKEDYK